MKLVNKIFLAAVCATVAAISFAAPPKLMIVPDKAWCVEKGYIITSERNGKTIQREDYDKAMVDKEFVNVRLAINQIMAERGFPLVNQDAQQEADEFDEALDEAFEGAESGAQTQLSAYESLLKDAKPDIIVKIGWNVNTAGSLYNADWRMEGVDAYSNKSVVPLAGNTGEKRRSIPLSVSLKETARANMDNFNTTLREYFDNLQQKGREVRLDVRVLESSPINLKEEFNGVELGTVIYNWVAENTVNHQFNQRSAGRNMIRFDQVRIPLHDSNGQPMDASIWAKKLKAFLGQAPYNIRCEEASAGLGLGRIYIGEK